jgi:hypothetical protein
MLTGKVPFSDRECCLRYERSDESGPSTICESGREEHWTKWCEWKKLSVKAFELVSLLLCANRMCNCFLLIDDASCSAEKRLDAHDALQHPWFSG